MKIKTKKNYLLGILLSAFLIIGIINITNGEPNVINTNPDSSKLHTASLRSLFLGDSDVDTGFSWMRVNTGGSSLDILNGLIVGSVNSVSQGSKMVVIGGGRGNSVNASNAGIAGGSGNAVDGENGAIGGGLGNMGKGIIAGGNNNKIDDVLGVILGGFKNISKDGIVLGGSGNMAGENSMAFGQNAKGDKNSFAWNAHALRNSARIDASGGMLIGTYSPVSGVYLVVSGSVKLGSGKFDSTTGGVWVNENGCIKASDGGVLYTLGRSSESDSKCGIASGCQFGKTMLHNGDKVTGYPVSYAFKCEEKAETVTCIDGKFYDSGNNLKDVVYLYCYDLSPNPVLTLTGGIRLCSGSLPANTERVNKYFKQEFKNGKWTPTLDEVTISYWDGDNTKPCSYQCKTNYTWRGGACVANTQRVNCVGVLPDHAVWVNSGFTQTWNGSEWTPSNVDLSYYSGDNTKPCSYGCETSYSWDGNGCVLLPAGDCGTPQQHFKCVAGDSKNNKNPTSNDHMYTWDCVGSTTAHCKECEEDYALNDGICVKLQCHHCSSNGFPYCFPINFNPTCNEGNYLN